MDQRATAKVQTVTSTALEVSRQIFEEERRDGEPTALAMLTALALPADWISSTILRLRMKHRNREALSADEIREILVLGRLFGLLGNKQCEQVCYYQ